MSEKILVTSYPHPDLDGCAGSYAYAEFLRQQGKDARAGFYLEPYHEADYVFQRFKITRPPDIRELFAYHHQVVLVDHSWQSELFEVLNPQNVVEVIDHHVFNEPNVFPHAKIQNDSIGAAATIVAERYKESGLALSTESAILLYSAIISNTVNFFSSTTSERDRVMVRWLGSFTDIPPNYIYELFVAKSTFTKPLREVIMSDYTEKEFYGLKLGIGQLEIVDIDDFVKTNRDQLRVILTELYQKGGVEFLCINFIDVSKGYNILLAYDEFTQEILSNVLQLEFKNHIARTDKVIMRKEILPLLKDYLLNNHD